MTNAISKVIIGNKKVFENFFSLFSIQIFNYILPLVTFPYLLRVLGLEYFGLVTFIQSIVLYFNSFTSYGFKLTGTDLIAKNSSDPKKVNRIFNAIVGTKVLLMLISLVIIVILCLIIPRFNENFGLIMIASIFLFGHVLFPLWFFQGMQNMKFIATFNVVAKSIFTILVFLLVKEQADYPLVIILNSLSFLIGGLVSFSFAVKKFKLKLGIPRISEIIEQIKDGFLVFISSFSVQLFTTINFILVGIVLGNFALGLYSVAYKIFSPLAGLSAPFNRSVFPKLSKLYQEKKDFKSYAISSFKIIWPIFIFGAILVYILAPLLVRIAAGPEAMDPKSIEVLRILSFAIAMFPLGPFTTQLLVIQGLKKELFNVIVSVGIINVILLYPVITIFGIKGLAVLSAFALSSVGVLNSYFVRKSWVATKGEFKNS